VLCLSVPIFAQNYFQYSLSLSNGIREYTGEFTTKDDVIILDVLALLRNDTIYVYAAGDEELDPLIMIVNRRDQQNVLTTDDDSGGGLNAMLQFVVPEAGDYTVYIVSVGGSGNFRVVASVNDEAVLQEAAQSSAEGNLASATFSCATADLGERPTLSGRLERYESTTFVIHYTLSGADATTREFVEVLAQALEASLAKQLELGWSLPPSDCGEGGDERIDVYVVDLTEYSAWGIAAPDNSIGDNPNTPIREVAAAYSHLLIDNDLLDEDGASAFGMQPLDFLQVLATHEMHHVIQQGYDANDMFQGFYEGGAVWLQSLVYEGFDDYLATTVRAVFNAPELCIGSPEFVLEEGETDLGYPRIYGEWLMIDSLARDEGEQSYHYIWEKLVIEQRLTGFYNALADLGTTPQIVIERMGLRNLLRDYAKVAPDWGTVRLAATATRFGEYTPNNDGLQELGVAYVRVALADLSIPQVYFELAGRDMEMYVVGIQTATQQAEVYAIGALGTVDISAYDDVYVMIVNTAQHSDFYDCQFSEWKLRLSDGRGNSLARPTGERWNAANYLPIGE
jgi:hypothetical protein